MRTWQELVSAARATGTYDEYIGDGFSVPWQTALPITRAGGLVLWVYKRHLDATYPEAARLHDWCYTPYGSLIQVTRAEADAAIRDRMLSIGGLTAGIDSATVFAAVTAGGTPYFGISQTGFNQGVYLEALQRLQGIVSTPNMPLAGQLRPSGMSSRSGAFFTGDPAMSIKVVIVFQQTTTAGGSAPSIGLTGRAHIAGWTEHVWWPSDSVDQLMQALTTNFAGNSGLLTSRAGILTSQAVILGVRLYQGGAGKGQFRSLSFPGVFFPGDIPQMAILCTIPLANATTVRRMILRGIPDGQVIGGELVPTPQFVASAELFFGACNNFGSMAADAVTAYTVFNVSAGGLVTLLANNPFAVGNIVTFRNVVDAMGKRNSGRFVVSAVGPLNQQFTVTGWTFGVSTGGDVRVPTKSVHMMTSTGAGLSRVVSRKVGRPFELYRGRRSSQRQDS